MTPTPGDRLMDVSESLLNSWRVVHLNYAQSSDVVCVVCVLVPILIYVVLAGLVFSKT
jgi:hypothetical protein